jgi:hypothetical protein
LYKNKNGAAIINLKKSENIFTLFAFQKLKQNPADVFAFGHKPNQ